MNVIQGMHGAVALLLICSLLFAEEVGIPLPIAPGEVSLLAAGLLIAANGLNPWLFAPLAVASVLLGALTGYSWARAIGRDGLLTLADRLRVREPVERVFTRLREAGPLAVGLSRALPGLRVYTNLVAGAAGVPRRDFLLGVIPVTVVWVAVFTILGALVGVPARRYLDTFQQLAIQGGVLVVAGLVAYLLLRKLPAAAQAGLAQVPPRVRLPLAVALDAGIAGTVTAGVFSIGRRVLRISAEPWVDILAVATFVALFMAIVTISHTGRSAGGSLGAPGYRTNTHPRQQH